MGTLFYRFRYMGKKIQLPGWMSGRLEAGVTGVAPVSSLFLFLQRTSVHAYKH